VREVLTALMAFVAEHQRYEDLDGGRENGYVWLACSRGARIVQPDSTPPPSTGTNVTRRQGGERDHPAARAGFTKVLASKSAQPT